MHIEWKKSAYHDLHAATLILYCSMIKIVDHSMRIVTPRELRYAQTCYD